MKRGLILISLLTMLIGFCCAQGAFAGVPQMINYQGTLTTTGGVAVPDGNYSIEFKIYDAASGGTALWTEKWDTTTSQITVVGGVINAMLGFLIPIPESFFADHPVAYLGIKVGSDSEMVPRQRITSVGYAFNAGNGVPTGGIIMWKGAIDQIPAGWALCDGANGTPNLKDRFIIGAGSTYSVGSTDGSTTKDLSHTHTGPSHTHTYSGNTSGEKVTGTHRAGDLSDKVEQHYHTYSGTTSSSGTQTTGSGGSTTQDIMPPYYALAFIMKL